MGTPYYMAPEQARGERDLDARVDLYACGVILYEALTGRRPFTASNYNALLVQIVSTTPRPASELRPALPAAFEAVISKAMARRREDRYATAADFQRDLQALRPPSLPRVAVAAEVIRASPPLRRRRPWPVEAPSSVTIPITFMSDTPGGILAVDPTDVHSRPPESSPAAGFEGTGDSDGPRRRRRRRRKSDAAHGFSHAAPALTAALFSSLPDETIYIADDAGRI